MGYKQNNPLRNWERETFVQNIPSTKTVARKRFYRLKYKGTIMGVCSTLKEADIFLKGWLKDRGEYAKLVNSKNS